MGYRISHENFTTYLIKCKRGIYGTVHFGKVVVPIRRKNAFPTAGRNCIFVTTIIKLNFGYYFLLFLLYGFCSIEFEKREQ